MRKWLLLVAVFFLTPFFGTNVETFLQSMGWDTFLSDAVSLLPPWITSTLTSWALQLAVAVCVGAFGGYRLCQVLSSRNSSTGADRVSVGKRALTVYTGLGAWFYHGVPLPDEINFVHVKAVIDPVFASFTKLKIPTPTLPIDAEHVDNLIFVRDYIYTIGHLLRVGHLGEARQRAKEMLAPQAP